MTRYVFEEVTVPASKNVKCATCGKSVRRSKTFMATLNPFNVNEAGDPKSRGEILVGLRQKATAWLTEPEECTPCLRVRLR